MTDQHFSSEPVVPERDGGLTRLRLDLSYDGTYFSGWAPQPDQRTVADVIERGLATVLRLDPPARLVVAGRTDARVHAIGQVAHVDVPTTVDPAKLIRRLSGVLPADIVVREVSIAPPGFNARFAAVGRHYVYRVNDGIQNPLRRRDTLRWPRPLDHGAMAMAAQGLVGMNDFAAYCKPRPNATTIRELRSLDVSRDDEAVILIAAHADAFCHNQIRSMIGALLSVGDGRRSVDWPAKVLAAGIRDPLVTVAQPHGLTLVQVDYPPADQFAARVELVRRRREPAAEPST